MKKLEREFPNLKRFIRQLYYYRLDNPSIEVSWWKAFVTPFIGNKEGLVLMTDYGIIDKIEKQVTLQNHEPSAKLVLLELFGTIISYSSSS